MWLNVYDCGHKIKNTLDINADEIKGYKDTFNIYRDKIIQSFIDKISTELHSSNDMHNIEVTEAHDGQIDINFHQRQHDSFTATYSILTHNNPDTPPSIKMAEPCLLNPNSYKNVQEVMTHIQKLTMSNDNRSWTAISCDGNPYLLMRKLQQTIYKCDICGVCEKFTTSAFCDHMKLHGQDVDNDSIAKYLLFGNVLPLTVGILK